MSRNTFLKPISWWFLFTVPAILASNTTDFASLGPLLLDDNAPIVNCTVETNGNVSVVQCIDYCGPDTWFSYQLPSSEIASGEAIWESFLEETSCQMDCGGNTSLIVESVCNINVTFNGNNSGGFSSSDVCRQYCDLEVPMWSECADTTNTTTTCRMNLPSPLVYTLSNETMLTLGNASALFIECPTGQDASSENCTCTVAVGTSDEECQACSITALSSDAIRYGFDCSNVFTDVCAIVNDDGQCANNSTLITVSPGNVSLAAADATYNGCTIEQFPTDSGVLFDFFVCTDFCGANTRLRTTYQESIGGIHKDATLLFWDKSDDFSCVLTCNNGNDISCKDDYFTVDYPGELCKRCDSSYTKPLFQVNKTNAGRTFFRFDVPSPLAYKLPNQKFLYFGRESSLFLNCADGLPKNENNCTCDIYLDGSPDSGASETCLSCDIVSVNETSIQYTFDCSNLFPYERCAAVNPPGKCSNTKKGFNCSAALTSAGYGYECSNYCGPDSQFTFTFRDIVSGTLGTNDVYVYDPDFVNSTCRLKCIGEEFESFDCAPFFALDTSPIPYREICVDNCGIDVSPYLELSRNSTHIRYQLNSLSPLQKPLADDDILFLGEESFFYMDCLKDQDISPDSCDCQIVASYETLFSERSDYCRSCEIGSFQNDRPVFGFDCRNLFGGNCAVVTTDGRCINIPVPSPIPVPIPVPVPSPGKGKGKGKGGKGKGGGMMMGMKTPKEPKTAKAMMASAKGKKAYKANAASSAEYSTKESDTPKGPMSSKQVVA